MAQTGPQHILQLAWGSYLAQLNRKPLRTKALTSAFIAGLSDVVSQRIVTGGYKNYKRTLALAIYGLVWNGPRLASVLICNSDVMEYL
jgi:peroxisomal membrane protein 2